MLELVSFTGADDNTDLDKFRKFLHDNKNCEGTIEMALLWLPEKEGQARNPTAQRREQLREICREAPGSVQVAVHLCGEEIFRKIQARDPLVLRELRKYDRVQLNINARKKIFTDVEVHEIYKTLWKDRIHMILQYHEDSADVIKEFAYDPLVDRTKPYILFDASRGKGVAPTEWPRALPHLRCGFAGGITPQNARQAYEALMEQYRGFARQRYFWMDMESGVRTNNEFDLDLCQQVLDAVSFY